ncbi:MAG: hypothetical protein ACOX48_04780 [Limnochordia bacterium]
MLDQHNLDQHYRINGRTTLILAVQMLNHVINPAKVNNPFNLAQQMVFRDQTIDVNELK